MRSSSEIWVMINSYSEDVAKLKNISSNLKKIAETILNYSKDFTEISDLLFEGYSIDGKSIDDGKMLSYAEEYKSYSDEIFDLAQDIDNTELPKYTNIISDLRVQFANAQARENKKKDDAKQ